MGVAPMHDVSLLPSEDLMERICLHIAMDDEDFNALARGETLAVPAIDGHGTVRVRAFARCLPGFDDPLPDPAEMAASTPPWPLEHPVWGEADVLVRMHEVFDAQLEGQVTVAGRHEDVCIQTARCDARVALAAHAERAAIIAERERIAWECAQLEDQLPDAA